MDGLGNPILNATWAGLFVLWLAWFIARNRMPREPRSEPPRLIRFGGPWTLASRRFWDENDIHLRPESYPYFIAGLLCFTALYFVLGVLF
jgi:hypothetical protein